MKISNISIPNTLIVAVIFLLFATLIAAFSYGVAAQRYRLFPFKLFAEAEEAVNWTVLKGANQRAWYYHENPLIEPLLWPDAPADGPLNLVTGMTSNDQISILLVDMAGQIRNEWRIDWFDIWPDVTHVPEKAKPRSKPGTHIHGIAMLPGGDVVFNFEQLGLVRLTPCGEVVWKLPYRTHHSVFVDEEGFLWVSGQRTHEQPVAHLPGHQPLFVEPTVLKVSVDAEILEEISVLDVLLANDMRAYMYLVTKGWNAGLSVTGDTLHLNDVEVFQPSMPEGIFRHGDIMISLRNVSTVLVFDPDTLKIRFIKTGGFVRQHDPDFIDGNTFSVFDNNHYTSEPDHEGKSRILIVDARTGSTDIWYEGTPEEPFYSNIMGKHQWLDDGHMLITASINGRGFELDANKNIVWEYVNSVDDGWVGEVEEVRRLDPAFTPLFTQSQAERCEK